MHPAAKQLAARLGQLTLQAPSIPVINNVDVAAEQAPAAIADALVRQLYSPVRWTETVTYLAAQGVTELVEIGPGKVLTGLNKRIVEGLQADACNTVDTIQARIQA
jgi:[acyl-carrier-protein] S-malonyltransferase